MLVTVILPPTAGPEQLRLDRPPNPSSACRYPLNFKLVYSPNTLLGRCVLGAPDSATLQPSSRRTGDEQWPIATSSALRQGAGGYANHEPRHNHHVARGQVWFCLAFEHRVKGGAGKLIAVILKTG